MKMMMVSFHTENRTYRSDTTVTKMQKLFEKEDYLFTSTYETLTDQMKKAIEGDRLERFVKELAEKPYIHNAWDHLGRTLLHVVVEKLNINFVRCLCNVRLGFQPLGSRHSPHLTAGQMVFPIVMINQPYSSPSKFEGHILQIIIAEHCIN